MKANPDHTVMVCYFEEGRIPGRRKLVVHSKMRTTIYDIFLRHKKTHETHIPTITVLSSEVGCSLP